MSFATWAVSLFMKPTMEEKVALKLKQFQTEHLIRMEQRAQPKVAKVSTPNTKRIQKCTVSDDALIHGPVTIYEGSARVYGNAQVYGNAPRVYGDAQVYGSLDGHWNLTKTPVSVDLSDGYQMTLDSENRKISDKISYAPAVTSYNSSAFMSGEGGDFGGAGATGTFELPSETDRSSSSCSSTFELPSEPSSSDSSSSYSND